MFGKIVKKPTDITTSSKPKNHSKAKTIIGIVVGIILLLLVSTAALGYSIYQRGMVIKARLDEVKTHGQAAYDGLKSQNLEVTKTELETAQLKLQEANNELIKLQYLSYTPLSWYYQDGQHAFNAAKNGLEAGLLVVNAVEPYADVIGFKGQGSFVGGTAEDRIVKIIETIDKVNPSLDEVTKKLDSINNELKAINPKRYPYITFQGQSVAELISMVQTKTAQADSLLAEFRPALSVLPQLAGVDKQKRYLVLFQNDAELRPTGGFLTAYALLKVEKGKVSPERSNDIYDLDGKFKEKVTPPDSIKTYLKEKTWYLRNMNLSPDFKTSMEQFISYYEKLPGEGKVDGVIAVDTQVLADLVKVLGPVDVPGFGTFKSDNDPRCNCPQVIYALEEIADRPTYTIRTDRKAVLGPLMQTILVRAYGAPKQTWPALFTSIWNNLNQKHVLMYFPTEDFQNAAEAINVAGRIKPYNGDYLMVNDANFGGAKSNMYSTQTVEQEITKNGNEFTKTISISYKNPRKGDNCNLEAGQLCLNGKMPQWTRVYLPKDAQVIETLGFNTGTVKESVENDKKVVEGYFELLPESQAKIKLTVKIPTTGDQYRLLVQKQPGTKNYAYIVKTSAEEKEFELDGDKEVKLNW